jgi:hypothetical protein
MLIRLFILGLITSMGIFVYRKIKALSQAKPPKQWTLAARSNETIAQALKLRASMIRLVKRGDESKTGDFIVHVDSVIQELVRLTTVRNELAQELELTSVEVGTTIQPRIDALHHEEIGTLTYLKEAHTALLDNATEEIGLRINHAQTGLDEKSKCLDAVVRLQRELNDFE